MPAGSLLSFVPVAPASSDSGSCPRTPTPASLPTIGSIGCKTDDLVAQRVAQLFAARPTGALTAVAKRDDANSPWHMTYTVGAGAVQLRIEQRPVAGQPGRFDTTIGPLDAEFDFGRFGAPVQMKNTGPLAIQADKQGGVSATIDGKAVFPSSRSTFGAK
jgi:hypothetical protein